MKRAPSEPNRPAQELATEIALLVAVAVCPAVVIPQGFHPFDTHKAPLLWTAAAAVFAALVASFFVRRSMAWPANGWRRALIVLAALGTVAMVVSTIRSEAPALAWWGSALRRYGTLTELSLAALLVAGVAAGNGAFPRRVWLAVVIGSVLPTLYAAAQLVGVDPLSTGVRIEEPPTSTLGNRLFLSGYLAIVWPLTLGWTVDAWGRVRSAWDSRFVAPLLLLVLQSAVLAAARSAGPWLALLIAAALLGGITAASVGSRRTRLTVGASLVVVTLTALMVAPEQLRRDQSDGRSWLGDTATVRWLMWDAVGRSLQAGGNRLVFGSGPESSTAVMAKYSGLQLRVIEGAETSPDRIHNASLETLIGFGIVGLLLRFALISVAVAIGMSAMGVSAPLTPRTWSAISIGALLTACAVALWRGGPTALAFAPGAAVVLAIGAWLLSAPPVLARLPGPHVAAAASLGACLAHVFEVQVGIATIASSITAVAAAIVLVGQLPSPEAAASDRRHRSSRVALAAIAVSVAIVGWIGVRFSTADILRQSGEVRAAAGDLASAERLFLSAAQRTPADADLQARIGQLRLSQADQAADAGARDRRYQQAVEAFERARAADPYEYHHRRSLAASYRRWARSAPPRERADRLSAANRYYEEATQRVPLNGVLFAEWGNLEAERGRLEEAFAKLDRAAALGATIEARKVVDALLAFTGRQPGSPLVAREFKRDGYPALAAMYALP